ncbi:NAD-dependent deacylase [bacterium]|nr:NAD-dependent deacylase [bacterium]
MPDILNINDFKKIVFFTGAGISAECGIPTYRGQGGIWHEYRYEDYACQRAFINNPEKVWEFHDKRRSSVAECEPADGHRIIAGIESRKPETIVITQNIDGMHQRAGSRNVLELHGSMWRVRCDKDNSITENFDVPLKNKRCACGSYLRPDIVWFEDPMKQDVIEKAIQAVEDCDLLITIGTSAMVFPAAQIPFIAIQRQIKTIEINIEPTPMTEYYSVFLQGTASEKLKELFNSIFFDFI